MSKNKNNVYSNSRKTGKLIKPKTESTIKRVEKRSVQIENNGDKHTLCTIEYAEELEGVIKKQEQTIKSMKTHLIKLENKLKAQDSEIRAIKNRKQGTLAEWD